MWQVSTWSRKRTVWIYYWFFQIAENAKAGKKQKTFSSELGSPVHKNTIHKLVKAYIKSRDRTPSHRVLELPKEDKGRPFLLCKYNKLVQNQN